MHHTGTGILKGEGKDLSLRPLEKILTCPSLNFQKVELPVNRFTFPTGPIYSLCITYLLSWYRKKFPIFVSTQHASSMLTLPCEI